MEECADVERVMDDAAYAERRRLGGRPLLGTAEDGMPSWFAAKMRLLHPLVHDEYESLLLARLCAEEASSSDARKRPLTVGEIGANWGSDLREMLLARYGLHEAEARRQCEATREQWLAKDSDGWVDSHGGGYGSVMRIMREALSSGRDGTFASSQPLVYILTSREVQHAQRILRREGIELSDERVLGELRPPEEKREALAALRLRHSEDTLRIVDDDAELLRLVAADPRLFSAQLFFAAWGHSKVDGEATVASMPRASLKESARLDVVLRARRIGNHPY